MEVPYRRLKLARPVGGVQLSLRDFREVSATCEAVPFRKQLFRIPFGARTLLTGNAEPFTQASYPANSNASFLQGTPLFLQRG
jgi:hypothetical protein